MTFKTLIASTTFILCASFFNLAIPTAAQAGGSFSIEIGNGRYYAPQDRHYRGHRSYPEERYYTGERIFTPHHKRHCSPRKALRKAHRLGLRHPRIVRMNRRAIKVVGRTRGTRTVIKFARNKRCSVLRIR